MQTWPRKWSHAEAPLNEISPSWLSFGTDPRTTARQLRNPAGSSATHWSRSVERTQAPIPRTAPEPPQNMANSCPTLTRSTVSYVAPAQTPSRGLEHHQPRSRPGRPLPISQDKDHTGGLGNFDRTTNKLAAAAGVFLARASGCVAWRWHHHSNRT